MRGCARLRPDGLRATSGRRRTKGTPPRRHPFRRVLSPTARRGADVWPIATTCAVSSGNWRASSRTWSRAAPTSVKVPGHAPPGCSMLRYSTFQVANPSRRSASARAAVLRRVARASKHPPCTTTATGNGPRPGGSRSSPNWAESRPYELRCSTVPLGSCITSSGASRRGSCAASGKAAVAAQGGREGGTADGGHGTRPAGESWPALTRSVSWTPRRVRQNESPWL